jgi:hypothetical protein
MSERESWEELHERFRKPGSEGTDIRPEVGDAGRPAPGGGPDVSQQLRRVPRPLEVKLSPGERARYQPLVDDVALKLEDLQRLHPTSSGFDCPTSTGCMRPPLPRPDVPFSVQIHPFQCRRRPSDSLRRHRLNVGLDRAHRSRVAVRRLSGADHLLAAD